MEPAQFRTFFCFLLGFRDNDEDLRLFGDSVERIGVSGDRTSRLKGAVLAGTGLLSLDPDPELVGRDLGEDSPDAVS
jgi:hypothetical protein